MPRRSLLRCASLGCALLASCTSADGVTTGGEDRFDAAPPKVTILCEHRDAGAGHTWTELYDDYFGPTGASSCAGDGACHGAPDQPGAKASGGYVCAGGKDGCYASITNPKVNLTQGTDPKKTGLYAILRKVEGGGSMPKRPQCSFAEKDLQRVVDWLSAGAKND